MPADFGDVQQGTLQEGEQARFQYSIPAEEAVTGVEIFICSVNGIVTVFVSFSATNPNSAFNDASFETDTCATFRIVFPDQPSVDNMARRSEDNVDLFISVEGSTNSSGSNEYNLQLQQATTGMVCMNKLLMYKQLASFTSF